MEISHVSAGVDWWRVASRAAGNMDRLLQRSSILQRSFVEQGHETRAWTFEGYNGVKIGSMFVGTRRDDALLNVSGSWAHVACVATKLVADRATRIDLRVDWRFDRDMPDYAKETVVSCEEWQVRNRNQNKVGCTLFDGRGKGDTLYVGSRNSPSYLRLYDKAREQRDAGAIGWWRAELQLEDEWACTALKRLKESDDESQTAHEMVQGWCRERGVFLPVACDAPITLAAPKKVPTTMEKKLNWLRHHVRSSVQELIANGYDEEVWKALFDTDNHSQK